MKLLIIIIIVLAIIALAQIMKVYQLSNKLNKRDEAELTKGETNFNSAMLIIFMLAFLISSIYLFVQYGARPGLGASGSEHGVEMDWLYDLNWVIILTVFFLTQPLLFIFAAIYKYKEGHRATWFSHSNKLELVWTTIPAVVLAVIIIMGLSVWNNITDKKEDATTIELYAQQFGWTARYSGANKVLGKTDFKVIDESKNPLGILTRDVIRTKQATWSVTSLKLSLELGNKRFFDVLAKKNHHEITVKDSLKSIYDKFGSAVFEGKTFDEFVSNLETSLNNKDFKLIPNTTRGENESKIARLNRQIKRLGPLLEAQTEADDKNAYDDVIVKELVLLKGVEYEFKFRSRDVLHSAYFPHFRSQMNCVPGQVTRFPFKPILTTKEMREDKVIKQKYEEINKKKVANGEEEVEFDYILLCNKICGASHYNMQMKITVVETQSEYDEWYNKQKVKKSFASIQGVAKKMAKI